MSIRLGGIDPLTLLPALLRHRITESVYWKDRCFGLSAASLVKVAMEIQEVGGQQDGQPLHFVCLLLKMLQLMPDQDIVKQYVEQEGSKYLRVLAAVYVRLTERSAIIYTNLEQLYGDYRRIRVKDTTGTYHIAHVDEIIDQLLNDTSFCGLPLPRLTKREILVKNHVLQPRISPLEDELEDIMKDSQHDIAMLDVNEQTNDHIVHLRPAPNTSENTVDKQIPHSINQDTHPILSTPADKQHSNPSRSRRKSRSLSSDSRRERRYRSISPDRERDYRHRHRSYRSSDSRSHRDIDYDSRPRERSSRYRSFSRSKSRSRSPKRSRHSHR